MGCTGSWAKEASDKDLALGKDDRLESRTEQARPMVGPARACHVETSVPCPSLWDRLRARILATPGLGARRHRKGATELDVASPTLWHAVLAVHNGNGLLPMDHERGTLSHRCFGFYNSLTRCRSFPPVFVPSRRSLAWPPPLLCSSRRRARPGTLSRQSLPRQARTTVSPSAKPPGVTRGLPTRNCLWDARLTNSDSFPRYGEQRSRLKHRG